MNRESKPIFPRVFHVIFALALVVLTANVRAADWQWSVPVESTTNGETNDHPRAFLWIPPNCKHVRAVVIGQHNMEEEPILENPAFRAAMSEIGFAEIWITPSIDLGFKAENGVGAHFEGMLKALAVVSGYKELSNAPVIPIGHSASAGFPWRFAAWNPQRTAAVMSVSGSWPYYKPNTPVINVPGLVTNGELEAANSRMDDGVKQRAKFSWLPLSGLAEMGGGHFEPSDRKIDYLCLYLKKVAQYRFNPDDSLRAIDPTREGWLVDRWRFNDPLQAPAAPVGQYKGNPNEAFWYFDEELARATEKFLDYQRNRKAELLGYIQNGKVVDQNPKTHQQVTLRFMPLEDGISFKLTPTFLDTVPPGRPEWWTGLPKGSPVTHCSSSDLITIRRICGPVAQTAPDTWAVQFYRMGLNNKTRTGDIWFFAEHPGDDQYKRAVQQATMHIPLRNTAGAPQRITFPIIPDQPATASSIKLKATSDAGVPVHYYVREGPAEIKGDTLTFTPIPPAARLPIKVTVVAWQYGRSVDPKLQSADPVERTFNLGTGPAVDDSAALAAIWDEARASVKAVEDAKAAAVARVIQAAKDAPNTISINFCDKVGMRPVDLAGAEARVGNWNNAKQLKPGTTVVLNQVIDKSGNVLTGVTATITVGGTAVPNGTFDGDGDNPNNANDLRLFNGLMDGDERGPTKIEITNIPYARYDVYFYRSDDGEERAGLFQIGNQKLMIAGGKGNPEMDGSNYVRSLGKGNGGNYVKFENLIGSTLQASFVAAGNDRVKRNKVVGVQIVERK